MSDDCCAPARGGIDPVSTQPAPPGSGSTSGMVRIAGGDVTVGTLDTIGYAADGETPTRLVRLDPYWIDSTAVTNQSFAAFIGDSGYRTDAERYGWSFVFHLFVSPMVNAASQRLSGADWWVQVFGANWAEPNGGGSVAESHHPVVHVSWRDAAAYASWAGKRLPTEIEWEHAAAGGLVTPRYPWGNDFGRAKANIFEGEFPHDNTADDGFVGTAPVDAFEPNGYGLFNMVGNVWEWTADWWGTDQRVPAVGQSKVIKGGSYLCHDSYCNRYRIAARTSNTPNSSTGHTGFRLARDDLDSD